MFSDSRRSSCYFRNKKMRSTTFYSQYIHEPILHNVCWTKSMSQTILVYIVHASGQISPILGDEFYCFWCDNHLYEMTAISLIHNWELDCANFLGSSTKSLIILDLMVKNSFPVMFSHTPQISVILHLFQIEQILKWDGVKKLCWWKFSKLMGFGIV